MELLVEPIRVERIWVKRPDIFDGDSRLGGLGKGSGGARRDPGVDVTGRVGFHIGGFSVNSGGKLRGFVGNQTV